MFIELLFSAGESMKCAISIATSVLGIDYVPLLVVRVLSFALQLYCIDQFWNPLLLCLD